MGGHRVREGTARAASQAGDEAGAPHQGAGPAGLPMPRRGLLGARLGVQGRLCGGKACRELRRPAARCHTQPHTHSEDISIGFGVATGAERAEGWEEARRSSLPLPGVQEGGRRHSAHAVAAPHMLRAASALCTRGPPGL